VYGHSADYEARSQALVQAGELTQATTLILRELGPEILGFLSEVLGDDDGDEVFSGFCIRLWRSFSGFSGRCSIRSWAYVLARHEIGRFQRGQHYGDDRRVALSELPDVIEAERTSTRSTRVVDRNRTLTKLRDELPAEDRALLILRVDRQLSWDEIALAFADNPESFSDQDRKREAARLRKRFQLAKRHLFERARSVLDDHQK
jgi:RNA polymerase sigma-70 factor (ECF subfamily)